MQKTYSHSGRIPTNRSCSLLPGNFNVKQLIITALLLMLSGFSSMAQTAVAEIAEEYGTVTIGSPFTITGVTATGGNIMWTMSGSATGTLTGGTTNSPTFTAGSTGVVTLKLTVTGSNNTATDQIMLFCMDANPVYWVGTNGTDWFNADNWTPQVVPTSATNVLIQKGLAKYPVITEPAECHDIILEHTASLLGNANLTIYGTASMQLNVFKGAWHFISAPNNGTLSGSFTGDYLQTWDETTAKWSYITATSTQLAPVKGYSLWSPGSGTAAYTFTGTFLSGYQSQPITKSTNGLGNDGSNLLGNPYPSYLDWETLKAYGAVYYWNGTGYDVYNGGNGAGSRYVAPMQGFFIIAGAGGTFSLTDANRVNIASGKFYKSSAAINSNTLVLQTLGEAYSDKLYIGINPETADDFDLQNDAYKLLAYTDGVSELYSYTGDRKLSIDVRPAPQVVQLGFTNTKSGEYQLGIQDISDIPVAMLEDTKTNTFHDLLAGAYAFSYTAGESDKRFLLHLGVSAVTENPKSEAAIYSNLNTVYINLKGQSQGNIYVYNMAGQLITTQPAKQGMNEIRLQHSGNYIVKVVDRTNSTVKKVWIN